MTESPMVAKLIELLKARPITLEMGVGGGGREFIRWVGEKIHLGRPVSVQRTESGLLWEFDGGRIVDAASLPPTSDYDGPGIGRLRIESGRHQQDHIAGLQSGVELANVFIRESLRGGVEGASEGYLNQFGPLSSIVDVPGWSDVASTFGSPGYNRRVENLARQSESFREHFRAMQAAGGSRLLDLGRVVYLFAPEPMHLGDEWANLASVISKRVYSLADVNLVLSEFAELFKLDSSADVPTVEAATPFIRMLFSGFVPSSSSEYVEIFNWMSRRAVASLIRRDSSDSFIRSAIPIVAARGCCLPALLEDGAVMLASDIVQLADYLERDPALMIEPGAKALLLHAHRLQPGIPDREAQMEFALRRMSLMPEADRIADALPERAWRPVWSSTSPSNVHRVLSEDGAGVLAIAVVPDQFPFRAYVGLGNGCVRQVRRTSVTMLDTSSLGSEAEIRGITVVPLSDCDLVTVASSDATVRTFRVTDPCGDPRVELLWTHAEKLGSPLTTATVWRKRTDDFVVLSGGVSGTVWQNDLQSGEDLGPLVQWGAEIRSIRVVELHRNPIAVVTAVDGRVGVVDLENGVELATISLAECSTDVGFVLPTPSCLDAVVVDDSIRVLVGCAMGEVFEGSWTPGVGLSLGALILKGVPPSGVNEVVLRTYGTSGLQRFIARNDGVWLRYDPDDSHRVKVFVGHAGPVLSQAVFTLPITGEVVSLTGGSEGTVRIWRHVNVVDEALAYLRVNRHRGAIRAVEVRVVDGEVEVATGGDDGDVRAWQGSQASRGWVVSQHQGHVSSFLWLQTAMGTHLVVGASDGTLRLASMESTQEPARLLGIAHEGVTSLAASHVDGVFWSAGNDGGITRWDALAGVARGSHVVCRFGKVTSMVTDAYGRVYVGGQDGSLTLVDPDTIETLGSIRFNSAVVTLDMVVALNLLILGLASGQVLTIDVTHGLTGLTRDLYQHELGAVTVKAIELHGQVAVVGVGRDRKLVVIDLNSRVVLHEIGLEGFPTGLAASGAYIAVSTTAGVTLFEFSDGNLNSTLG
jgi:WD40 repeat protein